MERRLAAVMMADVAGYGRLSQADEEGTRAERLQGLAEPGGIMISGTTYDHLKGKVEVGYAFRGEKRVKNSSNPVRVYRVLMDPKDVGKRIGERAIATRLRRSPIAAAAAVLPFVVVSSLIWLLLREPTNGPPPLSPLPDKPSIAVLPFVNLSDDPKQEPFAEDEHDRRSHHRAVENLGPVRRLAQLKLRLQGQERFSETGLDGAWRTLCARG